MAGILSPLLLPALISCAAWLAAQPGVNAFDVGWHNTTLYGYMNSALTAGKILALNEQQLLYAMGIAYHQSAGNAQAILDGALTKRLGPGFSARAGVMAARLAQKGVTGATRPLEGAKGMYALYHHNNYDRNLLLNELGQRFEGINVSFKPYSCCRGTHPSIDAALNLANRHNINPADIAEIIAINGPGQYNLLSTPLETKTRPQTPVDAQFSIPWTVAVALHNREVKMRDFTPTAIANPHPHILALTAKTRTELDPTLVRPGGGVEPARVDVVLVDGTRLSETVLTARGEPDARLTYEDSAAKFLDCAVSAGLPQNAIDQVINQVADLETMTDVTRLVSLLA